MTRENKNDKTNEKKRRQSIPTALKRAALKHFEISKNKQETRKRFKVSRQQIQQWFKNKEAINDPVNLNRNRRINDRGKSLKRAKYHDIELQLNNFCVTVRSIQNKMNELMKILEENTERLVDHFIERILKPYCMLNKINKSLFVLDKATCHESPAFLNALENLNKNSKYKVIPGGLTGVLQPADVNWFNNEKLDYIQHYNHWFEHGEMTFTKSGNLRGPGYDLMTQWITQEWLKLSTEYIAQSFKYCGITSCEIADYHSNFVKILQDAELPSNTTVESTNEGDEHNDVFVPYVDEANVETNPTDSFGESSLSSNASADDDGEGLSDTTETSSSINTTTTPRPLSKQSKSLPISLYTPAAESSDGSPSVTLKPPPAKKACKPTPTAESTAKLKTQAKTTFSSGQARARVIQDINLPEPVPVEKTSKVAPANKPKATKTSKASNVENKENTNETPACQKCKKQVFRACYRESCTNRICIFCFKIKLNANDNIYCTRACKLAD